MPRHPQPILDLIATSRMAHAEMTAFVSLVDTTLADAPRNLSRKLRDELVAARQRMATAATALGEELDRPEIDPPITQSHLRAARRAWELFRQSAVPTAALVGAVVGGAASGTAEAYVQDLLNRGDRVAESVVAAEEACAAVIDSPGSNSQKQTESSILDSLISSEHSSVRQEAVRLTDDVARHTVLARDRDAKVRAEVARYTADQHLLNQLVADPDADVRLAAVERVQDKDVLIDRALRDSDVLVRYLSIRMLSLESPLSARVPSVLVGDSDPFIRIEAMFSISDGDADQGFRQLETDGSFVGALLAKRYERRDRPGDHQLAGGWSGPSQTINRSCIRPGPSWNVSNENHPSSSYGWPCIRETRESAVRALKDPLLLASVAINADPTTSVLASRRLEERDGDDVRLAGRFEAAIDIRDRWSP